VKSDDEARTLACNHAGDRGPRVGDDVGGARREQDRFQQDAGEQGRTSRMRRSSVRRIMNR
jgi:hypothetical protein